MFLSLGSTSRRSNSGGSTATQGQALQGHGQVQGQDHQRQAGFEHHGHVDRTFHFQSNIQEDPLQALASGKYALPGLNPFPPFQALTSLGNTTSFCDVVPVPMNGALHPPSLFSSPGSGYSAAPAGLPPSSSTCFPASSSPGSSLPSSSLPISSRPSLSRGQILSGDSGSVFGGGGEEVMSRDHTRFDQPAGAGKRQPRALVLAKRLKESLGDKFANSLREKIEEAVSKQEAGAGAGGAALWPAMSQPSAVDVTHAPRPEGGGIITKQTWEGCSSWTPVEDRSEREAANDLQREATGIPPSPFPSNNTLASVVRRTGSLSSVCDKSFELGETMSKDMGSHEAGAARLGSENMEPAGRTDPIERITWLSQRAFALPGAAAIAAGRSLGDSNTTTSGQFATLRHHPWGGPGDGVEVCPPTSLLNAQFPTPTSGHFPLPPENDADSDMSTFLDFLKESAPRGWDDTTAPVEPRPLNPRAAAVTRKHVFPEAAAMGICRQDPAMVRQSCISSEAIAARQRVDNFLSASAGMGKVVESFGSFCNKDTLGGDQNLADVVENLSTPAALFVSVERTAFRATDVAHRLDGSPESSNQPPHYRGVRQSRPWGDFPAELRESARVQGSRIWLGSTYDAAAAKDAAVAYNSDVPARMFDPPRRQMSGFLRNSPHVNPCASASLSPDEPTYQLDRETQISSSIQSLVHECQKVPQPSSQPCNLEGHDLKRTRSAAVAEGVSSPCDHEAALRDAQSKQPCTRFRPIAVDASTALEPDSLLFAQDSTPRQQSSPDQLQYMAAGHARASPPSSDIQGSPLAKLLERLQ